MLDEIIGIPALGIIDDSLKVEDLSAADGWERFPEAKVRMRLDGLKLLTTGLSKEGILILGTPKARLTDGGIYIEIISNVGKYGNIVALPIEIFIPIPE